MVMQRHPHYLPPNHNSQRPVRHLFFDTETKQIPIDATVSEQKLVLGWALFWRRRYGRTKDTLLWQFFTDSSAFWDFAVSHTSTKETLYLSSHNITFDLLVCDGFNELERRGFELKNVYTKGMTTILRINDGMRKMVVVNNSNWFQCSLKALGKAVGLAKLDVDFDSVSFDDLKTYCKRDVEILYRAWMMWYQFLDTHNLGGWTPTLPSQAFAAFRHRFMNHKILVHCDDKAIELERASYHGGRSSVYYCGIADKDTYYKVDINSAYPFIMLTTPVPIKLLFVSNRVTIDYMTEHLSKHAVIADVTIDCDENPYPIIRDNHTVYPIGHFRTVLTTPELNYALERNWIVKVHRAAFYKQAIIFDEYVRFFYSLKQTYREKNNDAFYYMTKLFLNSLYGKFGQVSTSFEPFAGDDDELSGVSAVVDIKNNCVDTVYRFGSTTWIEKRKGETYHSMPAIAAHITAATRLYLHSLRLIAGVDHCYYSDTDSLIVDSVGLEKLQPWLDDAELGKLKVEGVSNIIDIRTPKTYEFGGEWKRKGIPYHAEQLSENSWQFDSFPSLRGIGRKTLSVPYWTRETVRTLKYTLYDGEPGVNGWVKPVHLMEYEPSLNDGVDIETRIATIERELKILKNTRLVPPSVMYLLWDFTHMVAKCSYTPDGTPIPTERANWDDIVNALGYDNLKQLLHAVKKQSLSDIESSRLRFDRSAIIA